jgi:hypothetical protein
LSSSFSPGRYPVLAWVVVGILFLSSLYIFVTKAIKPRLARDQPTIPQVSNIQVVTVWYKNIGGAYVMLQPYFFEAQNTEFNDRLLNQALQGVSFTYYKLWLINFHLPSVPFSDIHNPISLLFQKNGAIQNVPIAPLIQKSKKNYSIFFYSFLNPASVPLGHTKAYLVAFPPLPKEDKIVSAQILLRSEKHELSRLVCLRKDFEEYLESPKVAFWEKNTHKLIKK